MSGGVSVDHVARKAEVKGCSDRLLNGRCYYIAARRFFCVPVSAGADGLRCVGFYTARQVEVNQNLVIARNAENN